MFFFKKIRLGYGLVEIVISAVRRITSKIDSTSN